MKWKEVIKNIYDDFDLRKTFGLRDLYKKIQRLKGYQK